MKPASALFAAALCTLALALAPRAATAADLCKAKALVDVAAFENPEAVLKAGAIDEAVTQYNIRKPGGLAVFCSHGGSCYPRYVTQNGHRVEALRLTNCKIGGKVNEDSEETTYDVVVVRALNSAEDLKIDDADNRLINMGLCNACAGSAAYYYVKKPTSRCGRLTARALKGEREARGELVKFPAYCQGK